MSGSPLRLDLKRKEVRQPHPPLYLVMVMMMPCSLRKASTSPPSPGRCRGDMHGVIMMPSSLRKASTSPPSPGRFT